MKIGFKTIFLTVLTIFSNTIEIIKFYFSAFINNISYTTCINTLLIM